MKNLLLILLFLPMIGFGQCISGDCLNGYGKYISTDDIIYKGEWRDGMCHGLGTMSFPDGSKYVGGWKVNEKHGLGTYTFGSGHIAGDKYVGEFKDGKKHGLGTYTYADGTFIVGAWEEGYPINTASPKSQQGHP